MPAELGEGRPSCRPVIAPFPDTWRSPKGSRLGILSQQQMGKQVEFSCPQCPCPHPGGVRTRMFGGLSELVGRGWASSEPAPGSTVSMATSCQAQ